MTAGFRKQAGKTNAGAEAPISCLGGLNAALEGPLFHRCFESRGNGFRFEQPLAVEVAGWDPAALVEFDDSMVDAVEHEHELALVDSRGGCLYMEPGTLTRVF